LAAVEFLQKVKPKLIVTNNTGVAFEADRVGIKWIAGPYLNIVNTYSLLCLKESLNCLGAFISNEISKAQIERIKKPEDFNLFYSIYHPIVLMTSRQCLFHQVSGCEKDHIDDRCITSCEKQASITNLKKKTFLIEKSKGNYHRIYNPINFLNTAIVKDVPDLFSGFFIDLSEIKTETKFEKDKTGIIEDFENLLKGQEGSIEKIEQTINPCTNAQYLKGI